MVPSHGLVVRGRRIKTGNNKPYEARRMKRLIALTLVAAALTGCATVDGVGRDISGAARGVQSWF